ncbi:MAG: transposase [Patescibacteria group bacterium]
MKKPYRIAPEVKAQIINRIKNDGVSVTVAASEHGVAEGTIYAWLGRQAKGQPTWLEVAKLKKENQAPFAMVGELTIKLSNAQKKK